MIKRLKRFFKVGSKKSMEKILMNQKLSGIQHDLDMIKIQLSRISKFLKEKK